MKVQNNLKASDIYQLYMGMICFEFEDKNVKIYGVEINCNRNGDYHRMEVIYNGAQCFTEIKISYIESIGLNKIEKNTLISKQYQTIIKFLKLLNYLKRNQ